MKFMQRPLFIGIFVALMTLCCISCNDTNSQATVSTPSTLHVTPTVTPTPVVRPASAVKSIPTVAEYYQAVKEKKYTLAYSFVAPNAKNSRGQALTENTFMQMAQTADSEGGAIVNVTIDPASNDSTQMVLTIDRSSSLHYHAHLTLKQEGKVWKIISMDRL